MDTQELAIEQRKTAALEQIAQSLGEIATELPALKATLQSIRDQMTAALP